MVPMLREFSVDVIHPTTERDTIYSLLANRAERDPNDPIAEWQDRESKQWTRINAGAMLDHVRKVAKGFVALGVKPGAMVVIYAATSYDWGVIDFACAAVGAVSVPIYETDSAKQAGDILRDVEPVLAFAGDSLHAQTLEGLRGNHDSLRYVFNFMEGGVDAVVDFGRSITDEELDRVIRRVKADDLSSIVYTSGSTGKPKGVMLSHRNFTHIVFAGYDALPEMLYEPSRLLLFLPLAHCFARYIQYLAIGSHGVVGYIPDAKHLLADIRSFKPTYLLGVPRVFEKVYNAASQKAGAGIRGRVFLQASHHFVQWSKDEMTGGHHTVVARIKHRWFMRTVGSSIRSALGPNLRYVACGGAPISPDLAHFFNGIDDVTFIQGYGMTETAAPCLVNYQDANTVGSVGKVGPGIAVKLADDDELLIKGPNVFLGYYKRPELTAEVLGKDGWLHSGDLANIDDNGFVFITGRKKDIIITAGGKNISPAPLEEIINTCPIVAHSVVLGDGRPFVSALVALDEDMVSSWLLQQGIHEDVPMSEVIQGEAVRSFVQQYVDRANSNVSRAESVRKFLILDKDFTQEEGTLTPSLKVVRPVVLHRYAKLIDTVMYAPKATAKPVNSTAAIFDRTAETVKWASQNVKPALGTITPRVRQAFDQARTSVGERINRPQDSHEHDGLAAEDWPQEHDGDSHGDIRGDAQEQGKV